MNAIDLLKEDHQVVDELFKRVEGTPPSKHPPIFKKIKNELDTHAHIEEKVFYPVLLAKGKKDLVEITKEGIEEHSQIKKFLKEIARSTDKDKREAKLKVLIEDTRHHVKEEEDDMFPMTKDQFSSEELEILGERIEAERKKFQKAKKIPARRVEPKGTVATVIEKAKKLVTAALTGSSQPAKPSPKKASGAQKASAKALAKKKTGNGAANKSSRTKAKPAAKAASTKKRTGKPGRSAAAK